MSHGETAPGQLLYEKCTSSVLGVQIKTQSMDENTLVETHRNTKARGSLVYSTPLWIIALLYTKVLKKQARIE